ncbi:hypothetical protein PMAYCL1PPCAC_21450 [Pristionchus mayeri]|uniref:Uncharacterized protein n=1 Tax=Pristionchus mayeri TaxID=1317129 RepID=A0AAN5I4M6_9BILA|nr:hypothetical protein PMAYCL1PPCAC_21450 [Pristionchus mayeri]
MIRLLLILALLLVVASAIACDGSASSAPCISNECLGGQSCDIAKQWCCPNACICKYDICHLSSTVFLVTAQSIRVAMSSPRTHILHGMLPFICIGLVGLSLVLKISHNISLLTIRETSRSPPPNLYSRVNPYIGPRLAAHRMHSLQHRSIPCLRRGGRGTTHCVIHHPSSHQFVLSSFHSQT